MKVKYIKKEIECENEKDLLSLISDFAKENRYLDSNLSDAPEATILKIKFHLLMIENYLKKLLLISGSGNIDLYDKFAFDAKESIKGTIRAMDSLRENCLLVKESKTKQG